jgi:hypothetical protein
MIELPFPPPEAAEAFIKTTDTAMQSTVITPMAFFRFAMVFVICSAPSLFVSECSPECYDLPKLLKQQLC